MGPVYENVWPTISLKDFPGEAIAGSLGYDWFPDFDLSKRHYYGPGDTWWGADLGIAKPNSARAVVSYPNSASSTNSARIPSPTGFSST